MRIAILIVILFAFIPCIAYGDGPSERAGVLLVGGPGQIMLLREPFFDVTFVPALQLWYTEDVIRRSMRHYMPRTYGQLVEEYEAIDLAFSEPRFFKHQLVSWLSDAVLEDGRGFVLYGTRKYFVPWLDTTVGIISPVEQVVGFQESRGVVWIRVLEAENVLMASVPWSDIGSHGCFAGTYGVKTREGSLLLAEKIPMNFGTPTPFLTWWEVGAGRCLSINVYYTVDTREGNPFTSWEFYPDFVRNYILYMAGRDIPPDALLMHRIGLALEKCHLARDALISVRDFISTLGAGTCRIDWELDSADSTLGDIDRVYLDYEFEKTLFMAEELLLELDHAFTLALEIKNSVMVWIYFLEWAILTGSIVIVGSVAWTLMVRRRLDREIKTTRIAGVHYEYS